MRKKIVAGNWKMNKTFEQAEDLLYDISELLNGEKLNEAEIIVCPPSLYLEVATDVASEEKCFHVGAQNVSNFEFGAYTGEISAPMLKSMDVDYCIVGHSERRKYFNETNQMIAGKIDMLLKNNLSPIFCCGEVLAERKAGNHFNIVKKQLEESLFNLDAHNFGKIIIAYEPIWAIGTGVNASPEQSQEMHAFIRSLIEKKYGKEKAENTSILYGGSCKPSNAHELFANPDVDGGLIGGASLKAKDFVDIALSF